MLKKQIHHTLYVTSHGAVGVSHDANNGVVSGRFEDLTDTGNNEPDAISDNAAEQPQNSPDFTDFDAWVEARSNDTFTLVVDHVDEQQSIEEIPKLSGRDRAALIGKRIAQRFRDSQFHAYKPFGNKAKGRKGTSKIIVTALRNSVELDPWLDILKKHRVRIKNLTSPTLLAWPVIARIASGQTGLLVSRTPAGLRQTLLVKGEVRFSRLASLKAFNTAQVIAEIQRSVQYLMMTQRLARNEIQDGGLTIWLVDEAIESVEQTPANIDIGNDTRANIHLLNPQSAGLTTVEPAEGLSLWTSAARQIPGNMSYATPKLRHFERIAQWQRGFWTAGAAVCTIGLALTLSGGHVPGLSHPNYENVHTDTLRVTHQLDRLRATRESFPAAPDDLVHAPQLMRMLRANQPDIAELAGQLAQAFSGTEGLGITDISFQPANAQPQIGPESFGNDMQTGSGSDSPSLLEPDLRISMSGVTDPALTRTSANAQIELLASRMTQACRCTVDSIKLAHDPSPTTGLTGTVPNLENAEAREDKAKKFEVVWFRFRSKERQEQAAATPGIEAGMPMAATEFGP